MMNAASSSFAPHRGLPPHPTDPKVSFRLFNASRREDIFRTAQISATIAGFRNAFGSAPLLSSLPPGTVAGLHPAYGGHPATKGIILPPSLLSIVDSSHKRAPSPKEALPPKDPPPPPPAAPSTTPRPPPPTPPRHAPYAPNSRSRAAAATISLNTLPSPLPPTASTATPWQPPITTPSASTPTKP